MKKPTNEELQKLAVKWINKTITAEEESLFLEWYNFTDDEPIVWEGSDQSESQLANRLMINIHTRVSIVYKLRRWVKLISSAAIILLLAGLTIVFMNRQNDIGDSESLKLAVKPGITKAILTLPNGKVIDLTAFKNGKITDYTGSKISKNAAGELTYEAADPTKVSNYTVSTPIGTEYNLRLPDGSYVWLNSGSSITFPNTFKPKHERRISLQGEAYFMVKKDKSSPFKVITRTQDIVVLGTHFNVDSYPDEAYTKTTLLEGSVRVEPKSDQQLISKNVLLKPGQQLTLTMNKAVVLEVDTAQAVAWKNGDFLFRNEDFKTALRRISKWYNVTIVYQNTKPINLKPWGGISRQSSLSSVLKMLESTDQVHFKIERRTVIVTN
jgi:transmembrane sensor